MPQTGKAFDLAEKTYYYRRLPFKTRRLISLNPRLENARKLVREEDVTLLERGHNYVKAQVKDFKGVTHTVVVDGDDCHCTCNWFTNHRQTRGLCKHILAVKMILEMDDGEQTE